MKTGIEIIAEERNKQIELKGYDPEFVTSHPEYYANGQLVKAAAYTLFGGTAYIPENWPKDDLDSLNSKYDLDSIKVAAALLAAEIDRQMGVPMESHKAYQMAMEKASKWDALHEKIGKYYEDEDEDEDDDAIGLDTIGEIAAHALGYL